MFFLFLERSILLKFEPFRIVTRFYFQSPVLSSVIMDGGRITTTISLYKKGEGTREGYLMHAMQGWRREEQEEQATKLLTLHAKSGQNNVDEKDGVEGKVNILVPSAKSVSLLPGMCIL